MKMSKIELTQHEFWFLRNNGFFSLSLSFFFVIFIYNLLSCIFYKEIIFPEKNKMNKTDFNYV